jgi:multisubunit Na+/H+ antiporter MnhG subunit
VLSRLRNDVYRNRFAAQVSALVGTGLATVALGLMAFDLAGANAGQVLGSPFGIKMICNVAIAPVASALAARALRKALLVGLDLVRAGVAAALPFASEPWQIYILMGCSMPRRRPSRQPFRR